jgi:Co/Zn/Cd efflux system component
MSASSSSSAAGVPPQAEKLVPIAPGSTAKIRGPISVAILSIVTLGIYLLFWWYFVNREMADYGRTRGTKELGDSPTKSLLALFPGALIIVPAIWTMVTTFQRIQSAQRLNGQTTVNGWLGFVLYLVFSPALYGYMQSGLNSAWRATIPAN